MIKRLRSYYEPIFLGRTVLIIPTFWASQQATIKLWNLFFPIITEDVYTWLYPVVSFIGTHFSTLGFVEVGIKVGLIISYNRDLDRMRSERNRRNTVYRKK